MILIAKPIWHTWQGASGRDGVQRFPAFGIFPSHGKTARKHHAQAPAATNLSR
jgi:hypothetical protein